jgi:predicted amidohydrolase
MVLDPYGRILVEITKADDGMAVTDIQGALLEHATGRMWMSARRPELYSLLTEHTGLERDVHELKFEE